VDSSLGMLLLMHLDSLRDELNQTRNVTLCLTSALGRFLFCPGTTIGQQEFAAKSFYRISYKFSLQDDYSRYTERPRSITAAETQKEDYCTPASPE
jgi:hypothetical protein